MKCLNCGQTELEQTEYEKKFTTPFSYGPVHLSGIESIQNIVVPRYTYACLSCGFVQQFIDMESQREECKNMVEFAIKDHLATPSEGDEFEERVSASELSKQTGMPIDFFLSVLDDVLRDHKGYTVEHPGVIYLVQQPWMGEIVPVRKEIDGKVWIIGIKHARQQIDG